MGGPFCCLAECDIANHAKRSIANTARARSHQYFVTTERSCSSVCLTAADSVHDGSRIRELLRGPMPRGGRKRRTVLWLFTEDYEYLSKIADNDGDSKNISMHRLVKALREANVTSFLSVEQILKRHSAAGEP